MKSKEILEVIREACDDKQGDDFVVLDLKRMASFARYFVVVSGRNERHVRTLADNVEQCLTQKKEKPLHVEGKQDSRWILLDCGDVLVHVFHHESRGLYNLERLWGHAARV